MTSTTAFGVYDHDLVCAWERRAASPDALWRIRPKRIVVAAGAIERPLVVPDNDRPGVMSADAALVYLRRFAVLVGQRIAVATNNDSAYPVAQRRSPRPAPRSRSSIRAPTGRRRRSRSRAERRSRASPGRAGVDGRKGRRRGSARPTRCSFPAAGRRPCISTCRRAASCATTRRLAALVPDARGRGRRRRRRGQRRLHARRGARAKATRPAAAKARRPNAPQGPLPRSTPLWPKPDAPGRRWIDFQNDVTLKDVALAAREGYVSVEHLKRYTTLGMATDQGKTSNVNGLAAMAALTGRTIDETGTTTYRPPFVPVPMTVIGGRRRGAAHEPAEAPAARGRAPRRRRADARIRRLAAARPGTARTIRSSRSSARRSAPARRSALFDGSSLGKIEVIGPDAAKLVDFHSYNRLSTLKPGKIRYGFILSETGIVFDDGVTLRLADDRFLVSCSSGHTDAVVTRLELWRQDRFDPRRVVIHDATAQWATLTVTGPRARDLRRRARPRARARRPEPAAHGLRDGDVRGRAAARRAGELYRRPLLRTLRPGVARARALRAKIVAALPAFGGGLMGSEALMILRAEKGYIIVGKDTDGATMPHDLGAHGPARSAQGRVYRQALAVPAGRARPRPQAARRPRGRRGRGAAADRRACRRRRGQGAALARLCHFELFEPDARAPGRARARRGGRRPHGRDARRLSSRRRAAGAHRAARRARSRRKAPPCVRPTGRRARPDDGALVDAAGLRRRGAVDGLGQTLISGDLEAALEALAPGAPLLGLYGLAPEGRACAADRARPGAARHAGAARRRRRLARGLVRDRASTTAGSWSTSRAPGAGSC